jgi:hypothetical protein
VKKENLELIEAMREAGPRWVEVADDVASLEAELAALRAQPAPHHDDVRYLMQSLVDQEKALNECEALLNEATDETGVNVRFAERIDAYWEKSRNLADWRTRELQLAQPPLGNLRKLLEAYTLRLATDRGYNASRGIIVDELERILDADETKLCICRGFPRHPGECPQCSAASQPPEQAPYCTCPASYPQHMGHHPDCTSQRVESTKIGEPK